MNIIAKMCLECVLTPNEKKMGWRHALLPIFTENNENASTFKADPINELWGIKRKKIK